jgi:hypothetical protein
MKKILFLLSLVILTSISSCKKDDEVNIPNSDLIGTWAEKPSLEQFTYIFKTNGKGDFLVKNCDTNETLGTEAFTYNFDSKTNAISIVSGSDSRIIYVKFISKTTIRLYNDATYSDILSEELFKQ